MQTMTREAWTDERLDDLNTRVDLGFARMDGRFDRLENRIDQLYRMLFGAAAVIVVCLVGVVAG